VRLVALNLKEISEAGLGLRAINGDSGILRFSLNSPVLTFCIMSPFLCKLRRIHVMMRIRIHACYYYGHLVCMLLIVS